MEKQRSHLWVGQAFCGLRVDLGQVVLPQLDHLWLGRAVGGLGSVGQCWEGLGGEGRCGCSGRRARLVTTKRRSPDAAGRILAANKDAMRHAAGRGGNNTQNQNALSAHLCTAGGRVGASKEGGLGQPPAGNQQVDACVLAGAGGKAERALQKKNQLQVCEQAWCVGCTRAGRGGEAGGAAVPAACQPKPARQASTMAAVATALLTRRPRRKWHTNAMFCRPAASAGQEGGQGGTVAGQAAR